VAYNHDRFRMPPWPLHFARGEEEPADRLFLRVRFADTSTRRWARPERPGPGTLAAPRTRRDHSRAPPAMQA